MWKVGDIVRIFDQVQYIVRKADPWITEVSVYVNNKDTGIIHKETTMSWEDIKWKLVKRNKKKKFL